ncbi:MAG: hypothetical protein PVI59_11185 [Anaerolineae bacterium]|jgi:hypothetical protein
MQRRRLTVIGLLVLQVIAVVLYPPSFFQRAPQAIVLPPAFLLLFVLALIGMNTGVLKPREGRVSLVFVQGVNIVVRIMIFFANLRTPNDDWAWPMIITTAIGIALSWFTVTQMEKQPPRFILLRRESTG